MNVKWISHEGKQVLYADYRGMQSPEMIKQLEYEADIMLKSTSKVLYLGNFEDTVIDKDFMKRANELGKKTEPMNERSALVGVTGMKALLLNTYNLLTGGNIKAFKSEAEALHYLIK